MGICDIGICDLRTTTYGYLLSLKRLDSTEWTFQI